MEVCGDVATPPISIERRDHANVSTYRARLHFHLADDAETRQVQRDLLTEVLSSFFNFCRLPFYGFDSIGSVLLDRLTAWPVLICWLGF